MSATRGARRKCWPFIVPGGDDMKVTFESDVNKIIAKLSNVGPGVEALVKRQVDMSASAIEATAKALAPVKTGNLRTGIKKRPVDGGMAAEVYNNVEYAPYVEFGTHKMAAQPHMFPALEAERARFRAGVQAAAAAGAKGGARHA